MNNSKNLVLTGIRPTSNLTIANYIGAIKPILEFQEQGMNPFVFVADIHALTDNEPDVLKFGDEILIDLLAAGVDPKKTTLYKQSNIAQEIGFLTLILARHVSVSELLRLPTLKDKVKSEEVENANTLLMIYPVMMAADILIQRSSIIPVGKDQESHIEIARKIARRFNLDVNNIFPEPKSHLVEMVKILSLRGKSKMSKSLPEDAIFLVDDAEAIQKKINRAETANPGEMSENLQSHINLIKSICSDLSELEKLDFIIKQHMAGSLVMKDFKKLFFSSVQDFIVNFQSKREQICLNKDLHMKELQGSSKRAIERAQETMNLVYESFKI